MVRCTLINDDDFMMMILFNDVYLLVNMHTW